MEVFIIIKIIVLTTLTFLLAIALTPLLTHFLYKYKIGKKIRDSKAAPIMAKLHADLGECSYCCCSFLDTSFEYRKCSTG